MLPGRTTIALLSGIISLDPTVDANPSIDSANELVTEKCSTLIIPGTDISTPPGILYYDAYRLELIERWLSAHFYAIMTQATQSEQTGPVLEKYQGLTQFGLRNTFWGQQAMRLDTAGALAIMDNADNKYSKVPAAILAGITIGVFSVGGCRGISFPYCNGGGWDS